MDEGSLNGLDFLLPGGGMPKDVKFEYNIPIVGSNNGRELSFMHLIHLH